MDTESIRLFTEVIAHGGISEAARRNNLSQQTLSRRIIVLEEEVGAALLERGQHIRPTAAGKAFLDYAYEVMALTAKMRSEVKRASSGSAGHLNLKRYATESFFQLVTRTVEELELLRPGLEVNLVDKNENDTALVLEGLIDLGFSREMARVGELPPATEDGLRRKRLRSNTFPLIFGVLEGHPLASEPHPTLADIARYRVATPSFASKGPIPQATQAFFEREGLNLRVDLVVCHSIMEYYAYAKPGSVVIFNESFRASMVSTKRRRFVEIEPSDGPFEVSALLVYSPVNGNPALPVAVETLLAIDEELAGQA